MGRAKIITFCIITGLYWFSMYAYMPIFAAYARDMGANYELLGIIIGAYGFTQMLLRIPVGVLSDTLNRRRIFVTAGLVLSAAGSLLVWLVPDIRTLFISRVLAGAAAATWVVYTVLFAGYFPPQETARSIGIINAVNSTGQVAALFCGGLAAERWGQSFTFLLSAGGAIIGTVMSLRLTEPVKAARPGLCLAAVLETARDRNLLIVSALAVIVQLLFHGTVFGFTPLAAKQLGASDFALGLLTTVSILPGIAASVLSGSWFARRYGVRTSIISGFLLMALGSMSIPWCSSLFQLYISQIIGGFGRGVALPLLMSSSIQYFPQELRATAMGFFQAIYGLGMFLGPVLIGVLGEAAGLNWGFWLVGFLGVMGAGLAFSFVSEERDKAA